MAEEAADTPTGSSPRGPSTRRRLVGGMVFMAAAVAFMYVVLPKLAGFDETWHRLRDGDTPWLAVACGLEIASFGGYVILFRGVFTREAPQIGWRASYQITMAALAATRLFAAAGAGGIALTVWALRRSGMEARVVASRMTTFMTSLYAVYTLTLVACGVALYTGLFNGSAPFALTIVPAIFGAVVTLICLAAALVPRDLGHRWERAVGRSRRLGAVVRSIGRVPATAGVGVRGALRMLRARDPALLGALGWWGFDIGVLWACFHAFGDVPPWGVIVMGYFVGMLGNTLPLPGGVGGVEGGMIGAFIGFDVPGSLAVVAVLSYRVFAFWLPTVPGAIAYLQLRRTVREWSGPEPEPTRA